MAFVAVATTVGATVLGTGVAAGIGSTIVGGALLGAGAGGLYSAISGDGDILNSMLTGAMFGGLGAGIGGALFPGAAGIAPATTTGALGSGSALASQAAAPAATAVNTVTPAMQAAALDAAAVAEGSTVAGMVPAANTGLAANTVLPASMTFTQPATTAAGLTGKEMLGYGLAGTTALSLLGGRKGGAGAGPMPDPGMIRPFEYTSTPNEPTGNYPAPYATASYDSSGNPILDTRERNYFNQNFAAMQPYSAKTGTVNPNVPLPSSSQIAAAGGGIMRGYDDELGGDYSAMGMDQGNMQKGLFNMGYAAGGMTSLGGFSDGGRMLKGPGDGMSDDIPGVIGNKQPARLADGEFVVPADVVSHLGNGSTDAGAKRLYAMMDQVRKARTGNKKQGKQIKAQKYLPA